jgi:hypothetical protein
MGATSILLDSGGASSEPIRAHRPAEQVCPEEQVSDERQGVTRAQEWPMIAHSEATRAEDCGVKTMLRWWSRHRSRLLVG